jgi:hypothetical protein
MTNQAHTLNWVNPSANTDGTPFTASDFAGVEIELDGTPAVAVPAASEITSFDLSTLASWSGLKSGSHTLALAVTNKEGSSSSFSTPLTFSVLAVPLAPTSLSVV